MTVFLSRQGFDADVMVVGAGVVGLAVAARLAAEGASVVVLERHPGPGQETSSRNSEVIHAGIYYPPGSMKARLCVTGARMLYEFCSQNNVQHRRLGKLVLATGPEEEQALAQLLERGRSNDVPGLEMMGQARVRALEPEVRAVAALHSLGTGIVDSHGLIKALEGAIRGARGEIAYCCEVVGVEFLDPGYRLKVRDPAGEEHLSGPVLINCAGLHADRLCVMAGLSPPPLFWCKGDYFSLGGRSGRLAGRLLYPAPAPGLHGLGIHLTLDLAGRCRLGPDVQYLAEKKQTLDVDPQKAEVFFQACRRYLPGVRRQDLQPDMAGIRPKLQGPQDGFRDFVVQEESAAGRPGLITLLGIESPGLTCCLALAQQVLDTLRQTCNFPVVR